MTASRENSALYLEFLNRVADRTATYIVETTVRDYETLHEIKIDQSFVAKLPGMANDQIIVDTIITMGRSLGLRIVAEGVETEAQHRFLEAHGCHAFQGYLFSRPVPLAELMSFLVQARVAPGSEAVLVQ